MSSTQNNSTPSACEEEPSTSSSKPSQLPTIPVEQVNIKKLTLRELQEAIDRERKLLQSKSAMLSKLPDKGARIKQKLAQMEAEEQSRLQIKANENQLKRQSDVLQHVEFAIRSLSTDSARRLAEVVRSSLAEETEEFDIDDFDEDEETKQKRRMEEEEEEESVNAVLQMLAGSQISQNIGKQIFDDGDGGKDKIMTSSPAPTAPPTAPPAVVSVAAAIGESNVGVPMFAKRCANLAELHPPAKDRFVPNRFIQNKPQTTQQQDSSTVHNANNTNNISESSSNSNGTSTRKKTYEWYESLKTPNWTFNEVKTIKMEESFDLIAHLSNAVKGIADKPPNKVPNSTSDGRILNAFRTINDAATHGAAYRLQKEEEEERNTEESSGDEEDNLDNILEEGDHQDVDNLGDLINSTLTLT